LDGSGYPTGIRGDEIHPWARICAVVDVFDAMTCNRPYRKAIPLDEVCDYLRKQAGVGFDAEVVRCWLDQVRRVS
jgi:HD-GYP domain-containing protein (c-di-GMP phosphodiesterase class II)